LKKSDLEAVVARKKKNRLSEIMERFSQKVTQASGTSWAFIIALAVIVVWGFTGPLFKFSDTWQLVINTGTTIVTFLMVFLIQRSQNKDALAMHLKLNEIVAAMQGASNRLIDVESLTEKEIQILHKHYQELVRMATKDLSLTNSHSIEEAEVRHQAKHATHRHPTS
jgi:low affinity Fe/Cu permease